MIRLIGTANIVNFTLARVKPRVYFDFYTTFAVDLHI